MLRNAVGGGRVSDLHGKNVTKMYGSTLLALTYEGVGGCHISRKKCYVTLEWPPICTSSTCFTVRESQIVVLRCVYLLPVLESK